MLALQPLRTFPNLLSNHLMTIVHSKKICSSRYIKKTGEGMSGFGGTLRQFKSYIPMDGNIKAACL